MKEILNYFRQLPGSGVTEIKDVDILFRLSELDHHDRKQLRDSLLNDSMVFDNKEEAIKWLKQCFGLIDKHAFRIHKVLFSPGTEIGDALLDLLHGARESVKLCVFSITDHRLGKAIMECHNRGLEVEIITDDQKIFDRGSEIQGMRSKGIDIKIDHSKYHMHNKFGVIDNRIAFTGSFNWTYTAQRHNQENLLVTTNHDIVKQFAEEFTRLWKEMFVL